MVSFGIENKTNNEMNGEQLARYRTAIEENHPDNLVRLFCYKTGYVFDDERITANAEGYVVLTAQDMLEFMCGVPIDEDQEILRQYREYLEALIGERTVNLQNWNMEHNFVQFKFMNVLMNRLVDNIDAWAGFLNEDVRYSSDQHHVSRGRNRGGGGPWTQYWFCDFLFWRLDAYHPLRLRVWTETATRALGAWDAGIWTEWIETCAALQVETQLPAADFVRRMRKGDGLVDEGTVIAIDVKAALAAVDGDLDAAVEEIVRLHCAFLEQITVPKPQFKESSDGD